MTSKFRALWRASVGPGTYDYLNLEIEADNAAEFNQRVDELYSQGLATKAVKVGNDLLAEARPQPPGPVQAVVNGVDGAVVSETPTSPAPTQTYAQPAPQAPAAAQGVAPTCQHGERVFREGDGAKGHWRAWFCPTPKNTPGQCSPQWIK